MLRYTREVAFAAAQVYAREAEARGAWDARLEALIVDALVRGEVDDGLHSWAAALGWTSSPVVVLAGHDARRRPEEVIDALRERGRSVQAGLLAGVQGDRLIVIVGGADNLAAAAKHVVAALRSGSVVVGPEVTDLHAATSSAQGGARRAAGRLGVAGRAAPGPRRRSAGRAGHRRRRRRPGPAVEDIYLPLAGTPLLDTLTTYLEQGTSLEATARLLFVHPNTVRYRLRQITELTGYQPTEGRSAFTLQVALILGRLSETTVT